MDYEKAYKEALERAKTIIDGKDGWNFADHIEIDPVIKEIFPELRESEDERIRKALVEQFGGCIKDDEFCHTGFTYAEITAWLEKQKINTEGDFGRGYDCGYQAGYAIAKNEMKPKVATATPDSCKESMSQQEKQKPELVPHPITYMYPSDASRDEQLKMALLALLNSDLIEVAGKKFTKQDLIDWVEQKPNIELIQRSWYMEGYNDRKFGNEPKWIIKTGEGGPKHELNPKYGQPLVEDYHWVGLIQHLRDYQKTIDRSSNNLAYESVEDYIEWIKSLRPQPKPSWSEEDKAIVGCIAVCLDGQFVTEAARKQCLEWFNKHRRDFLNSPSWKPSEEQMNTLKEVINNVKQGIRPYASEIDHLEDLYEHLKKL